jgi:phage host-nuclease inhibitor protein Gam
MQLIKNKEQELQRIQQQLLERERLVQQDEEEIHRKKRDLSEIESTAEKRGITIGEKRQAKADEKEYTQKIDSLKQQIEDIQRQSNANYELLERYLHEECNVDDNMDIEDILKLQREKENGFEY